MYNKRMTMKEIMQILKHMPNKCASQLISWCFLNSICYTATNGRIVTYEMERTWKEAVSHIPRGWGKPWKSQSQ